ncbi:MAG: hypothetical protein LR001_02055 [Clostridiales bacterium]|nr:hypothetical protein [Clostridiales bacterium]
MNWEFITFAFLFGLFSSVGVCLVSCTPILISYLVATEKNSKKFIKSIFYFVLMRTIAFVLITAVILILGRMALEFIREHSFLFHFIGGAIVAIAGILIFLDIGTKLHFLKTKSKGLSLLAALFGVKPCIPHLAIWGYILTVGTKLIADEYVYGQVAFTIALIVVAFSVGENIVPLVIGFLGSKTILRFRTKGFKLATKIGGIIIFLLGIGLMWYDVLKPIMVRLFA